jgi:predicted nucleic acid-binding protein
LGSRLRVLLVDTNIVVYLLIEGDYTAAAQELRRRDPDWRSEAFLLVEFTNVLVASVAAKRMNLALAQRFLVEAGSLLTGKLARIPHPAVLATAAHYRISAYDARFLTLAEQLGTPLVTEDAKLRAAAPALTQSLAEALTRT